MGEGTLSPVCTAAMQSPWQSPGSQQPSTPQFRYSSQLPPGAGKIWSPCRKSLGGDSSVPYPPKRKGTSSQPTLLSQPQKNSGGNLLAAAPSIVQPASDHLHQSLARWTHWHHPFLLLPSPHGDLHYPLHRKGTSRQTADSAVPGKKHAWGNLIAPAPSPAWPPARLQLASSKHRPLDTLASRRSGPRPTDHQLNLFQIKEPPPTGTVGLYLLPVLVRQKLEHPAPAARRRV
ncbi:hypothetical protein T484DRAFT_3153464 [Baffinella frigidus]|nr:hypothetical protein T484DRAFT_3153464 [Cryptophyta sp. CCMP2293]